MSLVRVGCSWYSPVSAVSITVSESFTMKVLKPGFFLVGFPDGSAGEESASNAGDTGYVSLIPELGRSPGEANGNPLQCSCLKNPMHKRAWWATVHGVSKSQTQLSN